MADEWRVEFYREERGSEPVAEFIRQLGANPRLQARILWTIDLLRQFGTELPMPYSAPVAGHDFRELRVQSRNDIARVFYVAAIGRRMVLLHGFVKKTQKAPRRELATAQRRLTELLGRGGNRND
ncbi:MAG TPA: type II toxin-antitoxin system RelE/ParE family toxin [Dehalococcoidia bacterium]|nr:type II toxin-antitoxin system RelE/ParE family toxin [Dehalococcoidia bacterium]